MTNHMFETWLAGLDCLSAAQWSQLQQAVQKRSEGAAAVAAIELRIDAERRGAPRHHARATPLQLQARLSGAHEEQNLATPQRTVE